MYEIKYRSEDEMKDSGIEWLGKVPKSWRNKKFKYIFKYTKGRNPKTFYDYNEKLIPYINAEYLRAGITDKYVDSYNDLIKTKDKDILLLWDGANAGEFFEGREGALGSTFARLDLIDNQNFSYLKHYTNFQEIYLKDGTYGMGIPHVNSEILNNLIFYLPVDIEEQQKIANFLDIKTTEFDSIIYKKGLLIEKLEEAKKSLISEVVTGKVKIVDGRLVERKVYEMKDSGVEWLGMIPKDWEVKRLKYFSENYPSNVDKKSYLGEKKVRLCNYVDVYYNDYITDSLEFMEATASKLQINRFTLKKGNILLTKDSESPDDIAIPSYVNENISDLICGYHLMIVKPESKHISKYIYYQFLTSGIKNYFEIVSNGVTRYGIGIGGFNNSIMTLPKKEEQIIIVDYLNKALLNINSIINKTKLQIQKLKEAKQSLISEVVTGKIDLRDWEIEEI